MNNSEANVNDFSDFLKQFQGSEDEREFTIRAKAVRNESGWTILHAIASFQSTGAGGNNQQKSYGVAWTTTEDNQTPQKVGELSIQLEVAGEKSPPEPFFKLTFRASERRRAAFTTRCRRKLLRMRKARIPTLN